MICSHLVMKYRNKYCRPNFSDKSLLVYHFSISLAELLVGLIGLSLYVKSKDLGKSLLDNEVTPAIADYHYRSKLITFINFLSQNRFFVHFYYIFGRLIDKSILVF